MRRRGRPTGAPLSSSSPTSWAARSGTTACPSCLEVRWGRLSFRLRAAGSTGSISRSDPGPARREPPGHRPPALAGEAHPSLPVTLLLAVQQYVPLVLEVFMAELVLFVLFWVAGGLGPKSKERDFLLNIYNIVSIIVLAKVGSRVFDA